MSVTINVHYFIPSLTEDQDMVEVEGTTVGTCLEQVMSRFPKTRRWLYGEDGNVSNFIEFYVNLEKAGPDGLATPVKDGDEIHIVMMISGG